MAATKRQGREKPAKIEGQRKVRGPESGPQVEQTALLASPIYIGQAQGGEEKHIKRGAKGPGLSFLPTGTLSVFMSLSLSSCLWVGMPSRLEDIFSK